MPEAIRVRFYNVRFGDAILVGVPDRAKGKTTLRHILIDVGNVLNKEGGDDSVFQPVIENVLKELDGRPLDLYVMTHEHLDHVQGLFLTATKVFPEGRLKETLAVQHAWLTGSAAPDYYDTHPDAQKQKRLMLGILDQIRTRLDAVSAEEAGPLGALLANNDPRKTSQCVEYLRSLAKHTHYIHRGFKTAGKHPFKEARFEIWAPEEDTSRYYRTLLPLAAGGGIPAVTEAPLVPPAGVDAGAFYDLVEWRANGLWENLLAIDKAANNTSVVFALEWRGKRLLFAGDAELASWRMMHEQGVLKPVDFLKVSHHGSHNGTPDGDVLDAFLPGMTGGLSKRRAAISTWANTYNGIPHDPTNQKLRERCTLLSIVDDQTKDFYDVEISE